MDNNENKAPEVSSGMNNLVLGKNTTYDNKQASITTWQAKPFSSTFPSSI